MDINNFSNIKSIEDLQKIMNEYKNEDVNNFLKEYISHVKITNSIENKKFLKIFFKIFLEYLIKHLELTKTSDFIHKFYFIISELSLLYPQTLNETIIQFLEESNNSEISLDKNFLINFSIFFSYFTNKLNVTNQILSNYLIQSNKNLQKLELYEKENILIENLIMKIFVLGMNEILLENIKSYDPFLINQIEYLLNNYVIILKNMNIKDFKSFELSEQKNNTISILNYLREDSKANQNLIILKCFNKLLFIIHSYIICLKDDINNDSIFKSTIIYINEINNNLKSKLLNITFTLTQINEIITISEEIKEKCKLKKNVQINFLIVKKISVASLEPEYDLSFLGPQYKTDVSNTRAIEKKLNSTKKQALRGLKKESKIIDVQREIKRNKVRERIKADQKVTNQFIEQQNIEYKQLITSQPKKRYKMKRGKTHQK